ncbi:hypothetical protein WN943_008055 [Citrus x changshan-huyou]
MEALAITLLSINHRYDDHHRIRFDVMSLVHRETAPALFSRASHRNDTPQSSLLRATSALVGVVGCCPHNACEGSGSSPHKSICGG